jgi:hypothetical protein
MIKRPFKGRHWPRLAQIRRECPWLINTRQSNDRFGMKMRAEQMMFRWRAMTGRYSGPHNFKLREVKP